jgi:hypothetical protein
MAVAAWNGPAHAAAERAALPARAAVYDSVRRVDANRINMFVANDGLFAWDRENGYVSGLIWPKGTLQTAVYAAGPWIGAKVGTSLRLAATEFGSEYGPGAMVGGVADDPSRAAYRVYKVRGWHGVATDTAHVVPGFPSQGSDLRLDPLVHHAWSEYLAGAAPYGAPTRTWRLPDTSTPAPDDSVDVPGPDVIGEQMLWAVFNDADPALHTNLAGRTAPLGIEVQQTFFAFTTAGYVDNTVFVRYRMINKGGNTLDSLYVSLWNDADLGGAGDDLVGCDTTRALGYTYNAYSDDYVYGAPAPAVGFRLLRGLIDHASGDTLGMTSCVRVFKGAEPRSAAESWNLMRGFDVFGNPITDPGGRVLRYQYPGDPVTGSGWLDSYPADRRQMLSTGPVTMAPGDTQTVDYAIVVGRGENHHASVGVVRCESDAAEGFYQTGFLPTLALVAPCSTSTEYVDTRLRMGFVGARPNPVTNDEWIEVEFSLPVAGPAHLTLVDLSGRTVFEEDFPDARAGEQRFFIRDLADLPAGVYLVHVRQGGRRVSGKVVIVR